MRSIRTSTRTSRLWLAGALLVGACSEDLAPETADSGASGSSDGVPGDDGASGPSRVTTTEGADGNHTTIADATSMTDWVAFDFQTRAEADASGTTWDLAFKRVEIELNGGASGPGEVQIAPLPGVDFDTLTQAPRAGYLTDGADTLAFAAGEGWYVYDPGTHVVTPRDTVYAVRSAEGAYFKVVLTGYYDRAGTSGHTTFRWAPIDAPAANGATP